MDVNGNGSVPVGIAKAAIPRKQLVHKEGFPMPADADPEFNLWHALEVSHHAIQSNALFIPIIRRAPEGGHIAVGVEF